jgi:hypothetical protein
MNDTNHVTRVVRSWIKEPASLSDSGVARVALLVHETPQQRGWLPPLRSGRVHTTQDGTIRRSETMFTATRIAAAATIIALAGSLALVNGTLGPTSGPGSAPAAEAPSPSPSIEPAVRVEGVSNIAVVKVPEEDMSGPVGLLRGLGLRVRDEMNDPRANGTGLVTIDAEDYGGMGPEWGTFRLENDEGAWEGRMSGVHMGADTLMTGWLQGEGAYAGLTYYYSLEIDNTGFTAAVEGIIYPGDPPPTE